MQHSDIITKVSSSFDNALKTGDLLFFPSTVENHIEADVEYQIRLCPALQNKPVLPTPHFEIKNLKYDPFAPPYNANLLVGELKDVESQEEFVVLLNKYAVVPRHFLLVTKGGDNSGASQAHKHIQFIPLDGDDGPPIERVARRTQLEHQDRPFSLTQLAYASHTYRFPSRLDTYPPEQLEALLANAFLQLLDLTISTIRHDPDYPAGSPSYNVIITLDHLHIIPRRQENYILQESGDKLSVNALGYAGMLLVKSEEELEIVKRETIGKILRGVGLASVHDLQVEGTSLEAPLAGL
ncbi:hypothetical protein CVT25_008191 [Psilocybe cyanescens]|uniref:Uncharacterized protein n=1 Tax=Psilocybe cyanescens TaxID=93625 RepID=A0A409X9P1_PSICY|nr:hypothetical protein CVT25_008191 [Psilocybe cyanescens]